MTAWQRESHLGRARALGFVCPCPCVCVCVRVRAVTPVCPCYTFTIPAILRHIPAVIARGQRVAEGADCWDAWRWCLHADAVSSVTLTYSWWGLIKYAHISNGWASHCHHSHMIMEATSPYYFLNNKFLSLSSLASYGAIVVSSRC